MMVRRSLLREAVARAKLLLKAKEDDKLS